MTTLLKIVPELRNLVINGNMDFWQRGISDVTAGGLYLADRFQQRVSSGFVSQARSSDVPNQNSQYSHIQTVTSGGGASGVVELKYKMEGLDFQQLANRPFRLSFYVKSSQAGTYHVSFQNTGLDRAYVAPYTITSGATWQKINIDVPAAPTAGTWDYNTGIGLRVNFRLNGNSSETTSTLNAWHTTAAAVGGSASQTAWVVTNGATFQLTQVALYQIQASSGVDLPFYRAGRTISDELRMCQRYCSLFALTGSSGSLAMGLASTNANFYGRVNYPVTMRAIPTLTTSGTPGDYRADGTNTVTASGVPTVTQSTVDAATFQLTTPASMAVGQPYMLIGNTGVNAKLLFEAEL